MKSNYFKQTLTAHLWGYLSLLICHIIWSVFTYGNVADGDFYMILIWAAIYCSIFYLTFVLLPKKYIIASSLKMSTYKFALVFGIYSLIGFIILIGWLFIGSSFYGVFLDAFSYGIGFGFTFHYLNNRKFKLSLKEILGLASIPLFILVVYLVLLPKLFPTFAFKILPKEQQSEIVKNTLPKFKTGDNFNDLKNALPGYFDTNSCSFSMQYKTNDFQYLLVVKDCIIRRIEYGPGNKNEVVEAVEIKAE